jgi:hypothetical protein
MDLVLLSMIALTWVALAWHIKTTGEIYRAQADQTDTLIKIFTSSKSEILSSPKCEEEE